MNRFFLYIGLVATAVLFSGCFEDEDYFVPDGHFSFVGDIQNLKADLRPEPYLFTIENLLGDTVISMDNGISIFLNQNSFTDIIGNVYTEPIELLIVPANNISDWVCYDLSFVGENGLIDAFTAFKFYLRGKEGQDVLINQSQPPLIRVETSQTQRKFRYFQQINSTDLNPSWELIEDLEVDPSSWYVADDDGNPILVSGVEYPVINTGWHTLGQESGLSGEASVCINLPEGYTSNNTVAFLVMRNLNSVIQLNEWMNNYQACNSQLLIPVDQAVDLISISGFSGQRYFFSINTVIVDQKEFSITPNPQRKSLAHILEKVNSRN